MTQSDVEALLPTITPFDVPATMSTLYEIAYAQFARDAPGCLGTWSENVAVTYYIASLLAAGAGAVGVTSEKIDDYAVSFGERDRSDSYMMKYQNQVDICNYHLALSGMSTGISRDDDLSGLDLDAAGVYTADTTGEFV